MGETGKHHWGGETSPQDGFTSRGVSRDTGQRHLGFLLRLLPKPSCVSREKPCPEQGNEGAGTRGATQPPEPHSLFTRGGEYYRHITLVCFIPQTAQAGKFQRSFPPPPERAPWTPRCLLRPGCGTWAALSTPGVCTQRVLLLLCLYSEFLLQFLLLLCSKETEMPPLKQRLIHYLSTSAFPLARGSG